MPSNLISITALTQRIKMNWRDGKSNTKILQHSAAFLSSVSTTAPL